MDLRATQAAQMLDLVRLLAAQAVCIGHAVSLFGVALWLQPPNLPYVQNVGVQVFFVLSGFLIAHTLKRRANFIEYALDRFARIYSALVPALIFVLAVDLSLVLVGRYDLDDYLSAKVFLGNLFMLENWRGWFRHYLAVPSLGSAAPLWTLAIEWHIYIFVGALYFARRSPWLLTIAILFAPMPLAYLVSDGNLGIGHGLFGLWLMGFAGFYALPYGQRLQNGVLALGATATVACYLWLLPPAQEYAIHAYPLLAAGFVMLIALASKRRVSTSSGIVSVGASYAFTLYLVHYTVLYALKQVWDGGAAAALFGFALANCIAYLIALHTEMRHKELSEWLKSALAQRRLRRGHPREHPSP